MDGYPPFANLVYDAGTLAWVRMTQPLVDSLTSNLYLAVDEVESLLTDLKAQGETNLDGPPRDAFSRLRVSDPVTLFDSSFEYGIPDRLWEVSTAASASSVHSTATGVNTLAVTANASDVAILQSRPYIRYQPGKSQLIAITGLIGAAAAGVTKRWGLFDANNGIFLEQRGTSGLYFVLRTSTGGSPSDSNAVAQASWNLDTMDGNGASGISINVERTQILIVDLQWLGVGRVRVGFDVDGVIVYAHEFLNANTSFTLPYMKTANLPLRYEIRSDGSAGGSTGAVCSAVISEGGFENQRGLNHAIAATTGRTPTSRRAILSIRPLATFNGLVNRATITPLDYSAVATGTNIVTLIEIVYNPTFTTAGGALTWTQADSDSFVEYSVHGDANAGAFTGGEIVDSFIVTGTVQQRSAVVKELAARLPLTLDIAGSNPRALSLVATDVSGTATVYGSMTWQEHR